MILLNKKVLNLGCLLNQLHQQLKGSLQDDDLSLGEGDCGVWER